MIELGQTVLRVVIGENILRQKELLIIAEDGVIYVIPCERIDELTNEALKNLKEEINA